MHARLFFFLLATFPAAAQQSVTSLGPNLARIDGSEDHQGITYVRAFTTASPANALDLAKPSLAADCERTSDGKASFVLYISFSGFADTTLHLPYLPTKLRPSPPKRQFTTLTLRFVGSMVSNPYKREFEILPEPDGALRYNPPGMHSANLDDISGFLATLRSYPTLRVSEKGHSADFNMTPVLTALHSEPLCAGTGL